jgi:hypothetical protein
MTMIRTDRETLPSSPIAQRLEEVREERDVATIQSFLDRLTQDGEYDISYPTARRYHRDRDAPPHYLARVADVFGYELEWLATGKGPRTHEQREAERTEEAGELKDLLKATFSVKGPQAPAVSAFMRALNRYLLPHEPRFLLLHYLLWRAKRDDWQGFGSIDPKEEALAELHQMLGAPSGVHRDDDRVMLKVAAAVAGAVARNFREED